MKIQGPGPPTSPPETKPVEGKQKGDFQSVMEAGKGAESPDGTAQAQGAAAPSAGTAPGSVLSPEAVAEIADRIRSGGLSRTEAFDAVVDRVLQAQLGPNPSPQLTAAVRERLSEVLETDPFLSQMLDRIMQEAAE